MVRLMLDYRDRKRRKTYLIDRCLPNPQTLNLLAGVVHLEVAGEVSDMSPFLTALPENAVWTKDQYHIEPRPPALMKKHSFHSPSLRSAGASQ